jgi:hypothetical protein
MLAVLIRAKHVKKMDVGLEMANLYRNLSDKIHHGYLPGSSRWGHGIWGIRVLSEWHCLIHYAHICMRSSCTEVAIKTDQPSDRAMLQCLCERFKYPYKVYP